MSGINILMTTEDPANIDTPIAGRKRIFFDNTNDDHMTSKDSGGNLHDYETEYANAGGNNGTVQFNNSGVLDGDDDLFWDNTNKRLGIGTNSPDYQFHIVNGSPSVALEDEGVDVSLDDIIGSVEFIGGESTKDVISEIRVIAALDWTDTSSPSDMKFYTTPNGSIIEALRMTIDSEGNVGIGTHNPTYNFDLKLDTAGSDAVSFENSNAAGGMELRIAAGSTQTLNLIANETASELNGIPAGTVGFTSQFDDIVFANDDGGTPTEKMRLTIDGYLGIGTDTPSQLLEVDGNAIINGYLNIGGGFLDFESTNNNIYLSDTVTPSTIGTTNISIGVNALDSINDADSDNNVVIGTNAGTALTATANPNVIIGNNALDAATSYAQGVIVGNAAGTALTSGFGNVLLGNAVLNIATGVSSRNTIVGYNATNDLTTGNSNTVLGASAGEGLTSGSDNIFIGYNAGYVGAISDFMNIGNILYGDLDNGNVGIGNSNFNEVLEVTGNILVSNPENNGALIISPSTAGYGVDPELYIQSSDTGGGVISDFHISRNAYFQTSDDTYNRVDVAQSSAGILFDSSGSLVMNFVAAAANPISWSEVYFRRTTSDTMVIGEEKPTDIGADNLIVGLNSGGTNNTGANNNIIYGIDVAPSLPTGTSDNNVLFGHNIFSGLTLGTDRNVVIGNNLPMSSVQNASHNVVIGEDLLTVVSTLTNAIVIGRNSVKAVTNIEDSVVIGTNIDNATTVFTNSIAIGEGLDLPSSTNYYMNLGGVIHADLQNGYVSIGTTVAKPSGNNAGDLFVEGEINGMYIEQTNVNNTYLGDEVAASITAAIDNICIGANAGQSLTEGSYNILIGHNTGESLEDGYSNIFIGYDVLGTGTTYDDCVVIQDNGALPSGTTSTGLNINGLITGERSSNRIRIGGTATDALLTSAALEIKSITGALIVPRMTTTQRNAMTAVNGMIIYNSTDNAFNFRENGSWVTK